MTGRITLNFLDPRFSKALVLVKSRVKKLYWPRLKIIEYQLLKTQV